MALEFYEDNDGETRWRTKADNGRITASGESYKRREGAEKGVLAALKEILESGLDGVLDVVVDYVEEQAKKGLFIVPGGNGFLIWDKTSNQAGDNLTETVKNWKP